MIALAANVGQGGDDYDATLKPRPGRRGDRGHRRRLPEGVRQRLRGAGDPGQRPVRGPLPAGLRALAAGHRQAPGGAARAHGADAVAHGCTGKGNDQVRFEVTTRALAPDLEVLAPVREWGMTREDAIDYAKDHDIPVRVTKASPYSIDENLWGRAIECGVWRTPGRSPPEDVYALTAPTATEPDEVVISFDAGRPVALDGTALALHELIDASTRLVGSLRLRPDRHGREPAGRHQEPGGLRGPAPLALLLAHADLEGLTLERDVAHEKARLEPRYAELVYDGMWYSPLKQALDAFIDESQQLRHRRRPAALRAGPVHRRRPAQPTRPVRLRPGHLRGRRHASATRTPPASSACGASAVETWAAPPGDRGRRP